MSSSQLASSTPLWVQIVIPVCTAIIGAVGTIMASRFKEVGEVIARHSRPIAGKWKGESYLIDKTFIQDSYHEPQIKPDLKYDVDLKQRGSRVRGEMIMTETTLRVPLYKHVYRGRVSESYFIYECFTKKSEEFRLSAALLHIDNSGKLMKGYFVANARSREGRRTLVGYTVMHKL